MSEKIAIITDSASFLDLSYIEKNNIFYLPLVVVFENESLREVFDMTHPEFYEKLKNAKVHPKTSQPNYGEQIELYQKLKDEGYTGAISIHASGALSGTVNSAAMAVKEIGFEAEVIDSKIGSFPMQLMVEKAVEMRDNGSSLKEIGDAVRSLLSKTQLYFMPSSLEQLHKSGRVSGTASMLSNLLNIKLIIGFEPGGKVEMKEKIRSDKKARAKILSILEETIDTTKPRRIGIINCNAHQLAEDWKVVLSESYPALSFELVELSAAVGVHAGEGTIGLAWMKD